MDHLESNVLNEQQGAALMLSNSVMRLATVITHVMGVHIVSQLEVNKKREIRIFQTFHKIKPSLFKRDVGPQDEKISY